MRLSTPLQKQTEEGVRAPAVVLLRAAGPDDEPQPVAREESRCTTGSCSFFRTHHLPPPITSWGGLVQAQPSRLERDPLWVTRERGLAAAPGLRLLGRREQLDGVAPGEMLGRRGLHLDAEGREV